MFKQFASRSRIFLNKAKTFIPKRTPSKNNYYQYSFEKVEPRPDKNKSLALALGGGALLLVGGYVAFTTLNKRPVTSATYDSESIPSFVHNYVWNTYKYVGVGATLTAIAAAVAHRYGLSVRIFSMGPWVYMITFMVGSMGTLYLTKSIDPANTAAKHVALTAFNSVMGISLSPLAMVAPHILVRAGLYTLGIMLTMSLVAMNAKTDSFLSLGGPLMAGAVTIALTGLANMFLPTRFVRTLQITEAIFIYGGLALFVLFLLYDTHVVMKHARFYELQKQQYLGVKSPDAPPKELILSVDDGRELLRDESIKDVLPSVEEYMSANVKLGGEAAIPAPDYINESLRLYLNAVNIFIRLVYILSAREQKRR